MPLTPRPPQLPGYALDAPTHESAIAALARHLGVAEAERVWTAACVAVDVPRDEPAAPEALERVAGLLAAERSVVGVCACSIVVRLVSYTMLQRKLELRVVQRQVNAELATPAPGAR